MKTETRLIHSGTDPQSHNGSVSPPVYRTSTILFPTLEAFEMADKGFSDRSTYGRNGTPSTASLEEAIAQLEGADHTIVLASGVAAIAVSIGSFASAGDHVLVCDNVYGPTRRFCEFELKRYGIETTYYNPTIGANIEALIRPNTKVVYVESPGSLTFEMQDIPAIAEVAHRHGAVVIADNTWATPLYIRPFELGIDVSIHSATKYISGHSDLIMGCISVKEPHWKPLQRHFRNTGACASGDNCYLALRGLRTMGIRLKQHAENAIKLVNWLNNHPRVEKVLYPALPDDPGHALWKRDFQGATGLFSFVLKPCAKADVAAFVDGLAYFGMGFSWGGYESLIIPFDPRPIRTVTEWPYEGQALRIHAGLEHADDLIADLDRGFARMGKA